MEANTGGVSVYTVGHSTRTWETFLEVLASASIRCLVDVRRYPGSRRHPQFGKDQFAAALEQAGLTYVHEVELGGRRRPVAGSANTYWRNPQFQGYADHMATPEFQRALERVLARAAVHPVAVMCAEAHPSMCHRKLLSDALVLRGAHVIHLLDARRSQPHVCPPHMRAEGIVPVYPPVPDSAEPTEPAAKANGPQQMKLL